MHCPRDGQPLIEETFGGVTVDLCQRCGGAWFDAHELARLDDAVETAGADLVRRLESLRHGAGGVDPSVRLASPVEPDVIMMRHFADPERRIEIDECPATGGVWLDAGELLALRERFPDEATRNAAVERIVAALRTAPDFEAARGREIETQARVDRIVGLLSWITPWRKVA